MKLTVLVLSFLLSSAAFACGGWVNCYDGCTREFRMVNGDACTLVPDPVLGCEHAEGICGSHWLNLHCRLINCLDECTHSTMAFYGANTCYYIPNGGGCRNVVGICR